MTEQELDIREDTTLTVVRRRGLLYLNYVFWALSLAGLLIAANLCASIFGRWIAFLEGSRRTFGITVPVTGPDYWILSGAAVLLLLGCFLLLFCWRMYRRAWNHRLIGFDPKHVKIRQLGAVADDAELAMRTEYLRALHAARPDWADIKLGLDYKQNAEAVLNKIESDIAQRAVTAGLVVGLNRNHFIDSISILAAAFELQLFVLTRLGKRPSVRTWLEMLKRTSSSLFLNWYVSRGDTLEITLAIKQTAWGLGFAADLATELGHEISQQDIDWDEIVKVTHLPWLPQIGELAAYGLTVGASGLGHLSTFIDSKADELLQGVLAGGILYYHGMALAAECLALDEHHRNSPEMNRTIKQAMSKACAPAGLLLLDQVRKMRQFLRKRRRLIVEVAKNSATKGAGRAWASVQDALAWAKR